MGYKGGYHVFRVGTVITVTGVGKYRTPPLNTHTELNVELEYSQSWPIHSDRSPVYH